MQITLVAGARPNFMKIAPIIKAIENYNVSNIDRQINYRLVHTGQHYDKNMSGSFFEQLGIPRPNINLDAGGGSQAEQTGKIMIGFEKELKKNPAGLVIVVGDVTSTLACSIVAKKAGCKVAHVEGGIRSGDMTMPEEVNRIVTDSITDFFFTTSEVANENLRKLGVKEYQILFVGNTMIDTLLEYQDKLVQPDVWGEYHLEQGKYFVMTLHRPANVDEESKLQELVKNVTKGVGESKIIFPVHPRTKNILENLGIKYPNLIYTEPLGYLQFIYLLKHARAVITDSGGITEEATVLGVPCLTLRDNTERPETITEGTNELIGTDPDAIRPALKKIMAEDWKKGGIPEKWDGQTAKRIVKNISILWMEGQLVSEKPHINHNLLFKYSDKT